MNFHLRPRGLTCVFIMLAGLLWRGVPSLRATDRYVSLAGTNDVIGGYTNWAGAATNIQWAVDKATNSETVWVSNGTYYSSGVTTGVVGGATNIAMVIITNAITVRSFSGSYTDTVVNGNWPAYTNRVFLVSNALAVVSGLTITNGYMFTNANGGGVYICDGLLSNCLITGNTITNSSDPRDENYYSGAGVYIEKGTVSYCIMKGNSCKGWRTPNGSGLMMMVGCTIEDCIITANSGGSALYTKNNIVNRCKVYGNTGLAVQAAEGGGTWTDCVISNNTSHGFFTGGATLRNCLIVNNGGDGAQTYATYSITLQNCTFAGNAGKGLNFAYNPAATYKAENTISYYNGIGTTQNWYTTNTSKTFFTNCCAYPDAPGVNNITNPPLFVDTNSGNYRLNANSPCFNTGVNRGWMTGAFDFDGRTRIRYGTVDMGAYERINSGAIYGFH